MSRGDLRQMSLYLVFASVAAAVNIGTRYYLSTAWALGFTVSVTLAYVLGMMVNFMFNKYFNFPRGPRRSVQELRTFTSIALVGLLITNLLAHLFVVPLEIFWGMAIPHQSLETIAHVVAVGVTAIYSFAGHKYFTYRSGIRQGVKRLIGRSPTS